MGAAVSVLRRTRTRIDSDTSRRSLRLRRVIASWVAVVGGIAALVPLLGGDSATPLSALPIVSYSGLVAGDGPVGYWRLGESSGTTAADASGHGLNGTYAGGVSLGEAGAVGSAGDTAASFDGVDDRVTLPSGFDDFSGGLSIEAWVYPTGSGNYERFVELGNGIDDDNILLSRAGSSDTVAFEVLDGSTWSTLYTPSGSLRNGVWQHIAGTIDTAGNGRVYIDGVEVASGPMTLPPTVTRTSNFIARSNWTGVDPDFSGRLDEVAVFDRALTGTEVSSRTSVATPDPTAFWPLDEPSGTVARDASGNGRHGTYTGGPTLAATGAVGTDNAVTLDGTDDAVTLPSGFDDFTGGFTLEGWIHPTAWPLSGQSIVADISDSSHDESITLTQIDDTGQLLLVVVNGGTPSYVGTAGGAVTLNTWSHVAVTIDAFGQASIYVDATPVGGGTVPVPAVVTRSDSYLGRTWWGAYHTGGLDDVAVYDRALTGGQLAARAAATVQSYEASVLADGPVGFWRLGETSGTTAADATSNNLDGTYAGGVTLGEPGGVATSEDPGASFDGSNDRVSLPSGFDDFTGGISIEAWVYPTAFGNYERIVELGNGIDDDTILFARAGGGTSLDFSVLDGTTWTGVVSPPDSLQNNVWQHVAATLDAGGTGRIYIDGTEVVSGPMDLPPTVTRTSNFIGRSNWTGTDPDFSGRLDEVAIYDRPLTGAEISDRQTSATPTPLGLWALDETTGTVAADTSGNTLDGTYVGGPTPGVAGAVAGGTAVTFDGSNDAVDLPGGFDDLTRGVTIEGWVHPTAWPSSGLTIIAELADSTHDDALAFAFDGDDGQLLVIDSIGGSASYLGTNPGEVNLDEWTHVAATIDPHGRGAIYVNGQSVSNWTLPLPTSIYRTANHLGTAWWGGARLTGGLDDTAIYDRALTPGQIRSRYQRGGPPPAVPRCSEEASEPNNTRAQAAPLTLGATVTGTVCVTADVYEVTIPGGTTAIDITLTATSGGDLDLGAYDSTGTRLAVGDTGTGVESILSLARPTDGLVYIEVHGFEGATGPYDLTVEAS